LDEVVMTVADYR